MRSHQPKIAAILSIAAGLSFGAALRTGDAGAYALECEENEYGELLEVRRVSGDGDLAAQAWGNFSILRVPDRTFTAYDEQESEAGAIELELAREVER
ncbi:hypothetical protein OV203_13565 [Nannocystis sp. ILAH1]|uniref:hypothetical protein n=1 Tax=unclassified Nannocystis TaxID=2627009 RepID=UPI0022716A41|nr:MULTISPECIES: hypothetical protein [unclassified Nannocystis]MCY0988161.1 hypothetical protein [Nannocystis sp. ILAH1]MCY1065457.1 hypothetical protein [Nannocystis sp. RBIL2]